MDAYSEDLRRKIVEAVGRGMPKTQAARTFGVSRSSVKRYVGAATKGEPLAPKRHPKRHPGSRPKLAYLPPYSPDLNPIEQAFAKIRGLLCAGQRPAPARRSWRRWDSRSMR